jgi:prepilin-type N-terminal cleavage/methylation domain-containing protein
MPRKSGFTLVETLMVVAITVIVATIAFFSFSGYGSMEAISKDQGRVVSVLEKARALTLDSYNSSVYGVHFAANTVTVFAGAAYSPADPANIVTNLSPKVYIKNVSLAGGGSDIIFNRLSGETNQPGTTTLALVSASTTTSTIVVYGTGLVQPN